MLAVLASVADPNQKQEGKGAVGGRQIPNAQSREERTESETDAECAHMFVTPALNRVPSNSRHTEIFLIDLLSLRSSSLIYPRNIQNIAIAHLAQFKPEKYKQKF